MGAVHTEPPRGHLDGTDRMRDTERHGSHWKPRHAHREENAGEESYDFVGVLSDLIDQILRQLVLT